MLKRVRIVEATKVRYITEKPMETTNLIHKNSSEAEPMSREPK